MTEVTVGMEKISMVSSFFCLGDCLSSGNGWELAPITRCRFAWGKFNELLPVLTAALSHRPQRKNFQFMRQECHAPCKRNLGPNIHQTCLAWNTMTKQGPAGCAVSSPRSKSARKISWRWCSLVPPPTPAADAADDDTAAAAADDDHINCML